MRHTGHDHRGVTADAVARVEAGEVDPACLVCRGIVKSAAVMFGERPDAVVPGESVSAAKECQVFFAVAGRLQAQPAAALTGLGASRTSGPHGPRDLTDLAGLTAGDRARLVTREAEPAPCDDRPGESCASRAGRRSPGCPAS
ncbi:MULTISPECIES: hypothetical protein [unclassified Streptomyces]|uniref:hypothetical protein n=1 Tax=unclassified Streptomyces TaxID=2593676 RepID=UPI00362F9F29